MTAVEFSLNGEPVTLEVTDDETLLESLRGTDVVSSARYCCGIGVCGTCTVLLDERPASSCLLLTSMVAGREVVTAEGATSPAAPGAEENLGSRVQGAFAEARAYQCSFCIPAMALTVQGLLARQPDLTADELREQLGGNLCRCGSYPDVLAALDRLTSGSAPARGRGTP